MSAVLILWASITFASVAVMAAWFAHKSLARMIEIEDAIYKRLDEEFEPVVGGATEGGERT